MDMMNEKSEEVKKEEDYKGKPGYNRGHHGMHGHGGWWFLKIVIGMILIGLIFSLGAAAGRFKAYYRGYGYGGYGGYGMMRGFGTPSSGYYGSYMMGPYMMGRYWGDPAGAINSQSLFGTVSKIEGNKVTVKDNSGREQTVLTTSGTVIYAANRPIGLSQLKAGWNVTVEGAARNGQLEASVIWVN